MWQPASSRAILAMFSRTSYEATFRSAPGEKLLSEIDRRLHEQEMAMVGCGAMLAPATWTWGAPVFSFVPSLISGCR
jgi:hypothetical protein